MYAVIRTGGKQYRVSEGQTLRVEKLTGKAGDKITFSEVLLLGGDAPKVGQPFVKGAQVAAEIVGEGKGKKIVVFKFKRRKNYARKQGHRQKFTEVRIKDITLG